MLAAGCNNKKQEPAPQLPKPDRSFSFSRDGELALEKTEATAVTSPVKLTLRINKTAIKRTEFFWYQIELQNVGNAPLLLTNDIFDNPWQIESNYLVAVEGIRVRRFPIYGIGLQVDGPDGQPIKRTPARTGFQGKTRDELIKALNKPHYDFVDDRPSGLLEIEGPKERTMVDRWKKLGLSSKAIAEKLVAYNISKQNAEIAARPHWAYDLQPGERIATDSRLYFNLWDKHNGRQIPSPIGEFRNLNFLDINEPGKYRIRAVYNHLLRFSA